MGYHSVIAIDPVAVTGFAVFWNAKLWLAGCCSGADLPDGLPKVPLLPAIVVVEMPAIYPHGGKGDPNDLIRVAVLAGQAAGILQIRAPGIDVSMVRPRTWKGTAPKPVTNRRTLKELTDDEISKLPKRPRAKNYDHNMLDAVGLGLWQLHKDGQR